jgi:hypothetical protein
LIVLYGSYYYYRCIVLICTDHYPCLLHIASLLLTPRAPLPSLRLHHSRFCTGLPDDDPDHHCGCAFHLVEPRPLRSSRRLASSLRDAAACKSARKPISSPSIYCQIVRVHVSQARATSEGRSRQPLAAPEINAICPLCATLILSRPTRTSPRADHASTGSLSAYSIIKVRT